MRAPPAPRCRLQLASHRASGEPGRLSSEHQFVMLDGDYSESKELSDADRYGGYGLGG